MDLGEVTAPRMNKFLPLAYLICLLLSSCQPATPTVTLALLGDVMLARGVQPAEASLAYLAPDLQAADLAIANLESPLAKYPVAAANPAGGYNLCAMAIAAEWLPGWGLDLLAIANNHRYDCGPQGPYETVSLLSNLGLSAIGLEPVALTRQVNGLKLAFFSFEDVLAPLDGAAAAGLINAARADGAQVVVFVHWGLEYQGGASGRQIELAKQFAQAGAALVVGTHPHVLQRAEWIEPVSSDPVSRDTGTPDRVASPDGDAEILDTGAHDTLVLYSLGNALFDQIGLPDTRQSALVLVTLDAHGVRAARAVPFVIQVPGSRVAAADAQTAQQIHARIHLP